jgi:hypothetical protein
LKGCLNHGPTTVTNLDSHVAKGRSAHSVPRHVGKGLRRFLLSGLDVRQFHSLVVNSQFVARGYRKNTVSS